MNIERRAKYPGVKVHLTPEECKALVGFQEPVILKLSKKLRAALDEDTSILEARTQEEIKETLEREIESAKEKLDLMLKGEKWNKKKDMSG